MNDTNMGAGMVYDTPEEKQIAKLEARLAEVEKEREEAYARGVEDTSLKHIKFGCGHTNQGSCSQCLGHVTNERNDLLIKNQEMQVSLAEQGEYLAEALAAIDTLEQILKPK